MLDSTCPPEVPARRRGVIDQFEGDLAAIVFDDNEQWVVARSALPPNARTGDAVIVTASPTPAAPSIEIDAADTAARRERIRSLLDDLFQK